MSTTEYSTAPSPSVHISRDVDFSHLQVRAINGYPGRYAIHFCQYGDLSMHVTAEQWGAIDTAVRAGIAEHAASEVVVAS